MREFSVLPLPAAGIIVFASLCWVPCEISGAVFDSEAREGKAAPNPGRIMDGPEAIYPAKATKSSKLAGCRCLRLRCNVCQNKEPWILGSTVGPENSRGNPVIIQPVADCAGLQAIHVSNRCAVGSCNSDCVRIVLIAGFAFKTETLALIPVDCREPGNVGFRRHQTRRKREDRSRRRSR